MPVRLKEEIAMAAACPCLLHRCWRGCQWLAVEVVAMLYAAGLAIWPAWARAPIVVQCGDAAARRATAAVLRRALRDGQRVLGRPPRVPIRIRVLAAAGTPPDFADLGQTLAVWQVREAPGPRAVITLAATAGGGRLTSDQLVVSLTAALDSLDAWQPGDSAGWALPAGPGAVDGRAAVGEGVRPPIAPAPTLRPLPRPPAIGATPDDPLGLGGA
jgi:hypothetical protein